MKTFLVLMLLSGMYVMTYGQVDFSYHYQRLVVLTILQQYSDYEKECFSDSIYIKDDDYWLQDRYKKLHYYADGVSDNNYIYRKKITFQGFIDFLRERAK